ncbi:MAG: hypothetical protein N2Z21_07140, partial [Candidatus Sumerlaeaceae bacterium]|nr:hypothetical protein [Candidatus Sumerlaeaceae bacterium]
GIDCAHLFLARGQSGKDPHMSDGAKIIIWALVLALTSGDVFAQPTPDQPPRITRGEPEVNVGPTGPARGNRMAGWRRFWLERDEITTDAVGLRAAIREELRQVPTLDKHIKEFFAIQRERIDLERERRSIAVRGDRPTQEQLAQFHAILSREDQLASRSAELLNNLRADRQKIEQEVKARLDQLEAQNPPSTEQRGRRPAEFREEISTQRWRRFYTTVLGHLDALENSSSAGEWFSTIMRSLWQFDRRYEATVEGATRQLERLQREQEELRRRLDEVQSELDDLAELIGAIQVRGAAPYPRPPAPQQEMPPKPGLPMPQRSEPLTPPSPPKP